MNALSLDRLRDRAFGVELEFSPGTYFSSCSCSCTCADEPEGEQCWYCYEGCECGHGSEGVDSVYRMLCDNDFHDWADTAHEDGSGVEISSPILRGKKGLAELYNVVSLLNKHGAYVTDGDGLHVHHDAPEFVRDEALVERLVESWAENTETIELFIDEGRRGDYWACKNYLDPDFVERHKAEKARGDNTRIQDKQHERFSKLNIRALRTYGTVEFRAHEGTLDFAEIQAWIRFGQAFLDGVVRRKCPLPSLDQPEVLLRRLRVSPAATDLLLAKATGSGLV